VLAACVPGPDSTDDPESTRARNRWAQLGVIVGELSAPALLLNLSSETDSPAGRLAEKARQFGEPLHLSLRSLLRVPQRWRVRGREVFVCENPTIVAMAADRFGATCAPLICTDGMPSASQRILLLQLADAGARLLYHGDFDWAGIRIGNFVMRRFGARPWRFGAEDYRPRAGLCRANRSQPVGMPRWHRRWFSMALRWTRKASLKFCWMIWELPAARLATASAEAVRAYP